MTQEYRKKCISLVKSSVLLSKKFNPELSLQKQLSNYP